MAFADTYLVNQKLTLVAEREIDLLEKHFHMPVPDGYREFMTTLGVGLYCDFVRVYPPLRILMQCEELRHLWSENFSWIAGERVLSRDEVVQSVIVGDTIDGDQIIGCPKYPGRVFVLSRHDDTICVMDEGLFEPLLWRNSTFAPQWLPFHYFQSYVDRATIELFTARRDLTSDDVANKLINHWQSSELRQLKEEGCRLLFLKSFGGRVQLAQSSWDGRIAITIAFDKDCRLEAESCLPGLFRLGFHVIKQTEA
jgi:hypothetical protein